MGVKKNDKKPKKKPSLHNKEKKKKGTGVGVNNNLIPIKKGEIRNPKGRPPNVVSIPHNIREIGKEPFIITIAEKNKKGVMVKRTFETTRAKAIVYKMYSRATAGSEKAAQLLWERDMGKPMQTVALGVVEGEDINVIFQGADFLNEEDAFDEAEDADFIEKDGDNGQITKGEIK